MARQVAVAIGVAKVGGLTPLTGVLPGVGAFAAWAESQGFEVTCHDDSAGAVDDGAVFATVRAAVEAGDVARLFVFFSGHGMERGVGDDLWLLSDAADDPGAAVNVARSVALARHCGIPHVAFFADACRSAAPGTFDALTGRPIFPQTRVPGVRTRVDQFYATVPGDPAIEPRTAGQTFGIFTDCLLDALRGHAPEVVKEVSGGPMSHAVVAHDLEKYLWTEVRKRSSETVKVTQTPEGIPTSQWEPDAVAWIPWTGAAPDEAEAAGDAAAGDEPADTYPGAGDPGLDAVFDGVLGEGVSGGRRYRDLAAHPGPRVPPREYPRGGTVPGDDRLDLAHALADRIAATPGRSHFETGMGVSVVGAPLAEAVTRREGHPAFDEAGARHVRLGHGVPAAPVLLRLGDERWVATAAFPGYVTTVTVGDAGADHVAFIEIEGDVERDRLALAAAAAAVRVGRRDFAEEPEARRLLDRGNPTMALLAAYAYDRAGREDDVERVVRDCGDRLGVVPYDLALLAEGLPGLPVVAWYPLMARGWALSGSLPGSEGWFAYGRARLASAPWTTFTELDDDAVVAFSAADPPTRQR